MDARIVSALIAAGVGFIGVIINILVTSKNNTKNIEMQKETQESLEKLKNDFQRDILADQTHQAKINELRKTTAQYIAEISKTEKILNDYFSAYDQIQEVLVLRANFFRSNPNADEESISTYNEMVRQANELLVNLKKDKEVNLDKIELLSQEIILFFEDNEQNNELEKQISYFPNHIKSMNWIFNGTNVPSSMLHNAAQTIEMQKKTFELKKAMRKYLTEKN